MRSVCAIPSKAIWSIVPIGGNGWYGRATDGWPIQDGEILLRVKKIIKAMSDEAAPDANTDLLAHAKRSQSLQCIESMIKLAARTAPL